MKALLLVVSLVLAGCGGGGDGGRDAADPSVVPDIDVLPGAAVGEMAERRLEEAHPGMAPGLMTCPDLDWKVGASVRCYQLAELSDGRQVSIGGTVSVTDVGGGGKLHVQLDDDVAQFGITSTYLTARLTEQAAKRLKHRPGSVTCPYLRGKVGAKATCALVYEGKPEVVIARVTAVDPKENRTSFEFDWTQFSRG